MSKSAKIAKPNSPLGLPSFLLSKTKLWEIRSSNLKVGLLYKCLNHGPSLVSAQLGVSQNKNARPNHEPFGRIVLNPVDFSTTSFGRINVHSAGSTYFPDFPLLLLAWLGRIIGHSAELSSSFSRLLQFFLALLVICSSSQFIPIIPKTIQNIPIATSTLFPKVSLKRPKTT